MSDLKESPFSKRSNLIARSPIKQDSSTVPKHRTRSQTTSSRPPTPPIVPKLPGNQTSKPLATHPTLPLNPICKQIVDRTSTQLPTALPKDIQATHKLYSPEIKHISKVTTSTVTLKMEQQQIQKIISMSVPEFGGDITQDRSNDLIRFTATADSIYSTLTTQEEKAIFDRLIKLRLTGEAFIRISHRNVKDYPALREILNNMYSRTYSLDELERGYTTIQQSYGESVRNYGYRLLEALERYKTGYMSKYSLNQIDAAYTMHLETNSVQTFKRGLNNTILREKIATSIAKNIDDIIKETEIAERMLISTTNTPVYQPQIYPHMTQTQPQRFPTITQPQTQIYPPIESQPLNQIICHYCHKPNHTWRNCRSRMQSESMMQKRSNYPQVTYNPMQNQQRQNIPQFPQRTTQFSNNNRYSQPQTNNFAYQQPPPRNNYSQKYCSFCKTTTGHTFDECRSKFLGNQKFDVNQNFKPNTGQNQTNNLEEQFNKLRINMVAPNENLINEPQYYNSGNA